jgi:hypothetical protein
LIPSSWLTAPFMCGVCGSANDSNTPFHSTNPWLVPLALTQNPDVLPLLSIPVTWVCAERGKFSFT